MASYDKFFATVLDDLDRYHQRARRGERVLVEWSDEERTGVVWSTLDTIM
jgi:hypothetical protein